MSFGLKDRLLGAAQQTFRPSLAAVGERDVYLRERDFFKMIGLALAMHALVLGIASIWPSEKVTDIPVRALSFKIGQGERIRPLQVAQPAPPPAPVMQATPPAPQPVVKPQPRPQPVKKPKVVPVTERPTQQYGPPVAHYTPPRQALPDTNSLTARQAAIAPTPQRFVREMPVAPAPVAAAPSASGTALATAQAQAFETAQAARLRYEQEISGWILRHYPQNVESGPRKLRPVVRMRIDRSGYVRYYAIEESSGLQTIDAAAIDMIRRANPMPAVPETYPAGNLIEFLIPIVFRVP